MAEPDLTQWLQELFSTAADNDTAIQNAWQQLDHAGRLSKVTVHTYLCRKCGPLARVIRLGDRTIAGVKDYKQSPGMNQAKSVPAARKRNTLDGNRHWPSHAYDVDQLAADLGGNGGFTVACRHVTTTVRAVDVLAVAADVKPGHPGAPTPL